jgi:hypothetical protein
MVLHKPSDTLARQVLTTVHCSIAIQQRCVQHDGNSSGLGIIARIRAGYGALPWPAARLEQDKQYPCAINCKPMESASGSYAIVRRSLQGVKVCIHIPIERRYASENMLSAVDKIEYN